jgi:hypothetical protein
MIRNLFLTLIAVAAFAAASHAQAKPDYSGTWKLDISKSQFTEYGVPRARTDVIAQDGDKFTQKVVSTSDQGTANYTLTFTADGKPVDIKGDSPAANQGMLTAQKISAAWQDGVLVVTEDMTYQGQYYFTSTLTYVLSQDGKTLTITSHSATEAGDIVTKHVFAKQ